MTPYYNKRVSTIIVPVSTTRTFRVYGKSFFKITNVYLSGSPYTNTTIQNPFSAVPKLSAAYPSFTGIKLLSSNYEVNESSNSIVFTMPSASRVGYVDVIVENPAGYGKLTQFVIKELYGTNLTNSELRPWSQGILVTQPTPSAEALPQMYTLSGDKLVTIAGEFIIPIPPGTYIPPLPPSGETFYIVTDNNEILITNTGDTITYGV